MHQKSPLIFPVPAWMSSSAGHMMQKKTTKLNVEKPFLAYKHLPNDEYPFNIQVHQMLIFRHQQTIDLLKCTQDHPYYSKLSNRAKPNHIIQKIASQRSFRNSEWSAIINPEILETCLEDFAIVGDAPSVYGTSSNRKML